MFTRSLYLNNTMTGRLQPGRQDLMLANVSNHRYKVDVEQVCYIMVTLLLAHIRKWRWCLFSQQVWQKVQVTPLEPANQLNLLFSQEVEPSPSMIVQPKQSFKVKP